MAGSVYEERMLQELLDGIDELRFLVDFGYEVDVGLLESMAHSARGTSSSRSTMWQIADEIDYMKWMIDHGYEIDIQEVEFLEHLVKEYLL